MGIGGIGGPGKIDPIGPVRGSRPVRREKLQDGKGASDDPPEKKNQPPPLPEGGDDLLGCLTQGGAALAVAYLLYRLLKR